MRLKLVDKMFMDILLSQQTKHAKLFEQAAPLKCSLSSFNRLLCN